MRSFLIPLLCGLALGSSLACADDPPAPEPKRDTPTPSRDADPRPFGGDHDFVVDLEGNLYAFDVVKVRWKVLGRIGAGKADRPVLCDLASTPEGWVYGISDTALYLIDTKRPGRSKRLGEHGLTGPWGMTAVGARLFVNTKGGEVFVLDRKSGKPTKIGSMGPYRASGDVAYGGNKLYSSVKDAKDQECLVELDPRTGKARRVGRLVTKEGTEVRDVFGMIDHERFLYGVTSSGWIVRIDPKTARCVVLKKTKIRWWGATSYTRL